MTDTWRECQAHGHALLDHTDRETGEAMVLRIPWESRHTSLGWGDRPRVYWPGADKSESMGMELRRGHAGITARDEKGELHMLRHGDYRVGQKTQQDLLKAADRPPPKPGSRWITVHPHGPGSKGVPILIEPAGDGTHRVVGGAGGSMNHLRIRNVKSEAEYKSQAKEKAKAKRAKERGEAAKLTPEERKAKRELKLAKKVALRKAERGLVEKIREKAGGVDPDLPEGHLDGLSEAAQTKLERQHHRRQFRQAMKRKDEIAHSLAQERVERLQDQAAIDDLLEEAPDMAAAARLMGERELVAIEAAREARLLARKAPTRVTSGAMETIDRAADAAIEHVQALDPEELAVRLEEAGGRRSTRKGPLELTAPPSQEMQRRALEQVDNARILADAVEGVTPDDDPSRAAVELQVIEAALKEHGLTLADDRDLVETALRREAGAELRESQLSDLKASEMKEMEADGDTEQAVRAMAYTDTLRGVNEEVAEAAERLGLRSKDRAPLREAEMAEMMEILGDADRFRQEKKELASMTKAAEPPAYDQSRRAFDLEAGPSASMVEQAEERVLRELAQRLTGVASPHRPAHAQAVADGHYAKIGDIALSVANEHYLDRSVIDAVGLTNATVIMRHAMERDGHDSGAILDALSAHHMREQKSLTVKALRQADAFVPSIEDSIGGVDDIEHVLRQLDAGQDDIDAAQAAIGSALGQMEATATMAQTFRSQMPDSFELDAHGDLNGHLQWLGSVGLGPGDYQIDRKAKKITVPRESWDKLTTKTDSSVVEARKAVHDIKRGEHDEDGWMPAGMVSRDATTFSNPPKDAPRYHQALDLASNDLRQNLEDHIGSRLSDGERPHDIEKDLLSAQIVDRAPDSDAYTAHIQELFPHTVEKDTQDREHNRHIRAQKLALADQYASAERSGDTDAMAETIAQLGGLPSERETTERRDVHFEEHYQGLAGRFMAKNHPDHAPLHSRSLYQGVSREHVHEAAFRTLAEQPHAVAAFVPLAQLSHDQSRALQSYYYQRMGLTDRTWAKEFQSHLDERVEAMQAGASTAPSMGGLFGGGGAQSTEADLSAANFGEQQPEAAKQLANTYPREAGDLFAQAMGERPPDAGRPDIPADHLAALDAEHEARPHLGVPELVDRANKRLGRDAAMSDLGISAAQLTATGPGGELTPDAESARNRVLARASALRGRIYGGDVHDHFAPKIWDGEVAAFDAHRRRNATPWAQFVNAHGDRGRALQSLQDEIKGTFVESFQQHYGKVADQGVQTRLAEVRHAGLHSDAMVTPRQRAAVADARRKEIQALAASKKAGRGALGAGGKKIGGQFQGGSVLAARAKQKDEEASHMQRQAGMFGGGQAGMFGAPEPVSMFGSPKTPDKILIHKDPIAKREAKPGERAALGQRAEGELASIIGNQLGQQFDPNQSPSKLFAGASMDGRRVHSQRVIKQLHAVKRVAAHLGTGSGKTPTSIGAFTDLHAAGKASHGLYLVPKAVQNQFGEEMLAFTEPGKYRWETGDKKSHADRVGMLRNGDVHMRVMTHQGFAQTITRVLADHYGVSREAIVARMRKQSDGERAETVQAAFKAQGIPQHFTYVDEAHMTTTRAGEQESSQAIILNAVTHPTNSPHYLRGTATPHKNDVSEIHSEARSLDPDRYSDRYRFSQAHGAGTLSAPESVRRELDHLTYAAKIDPEGVERRDSTNPTVDIEGKKVSTGPLKLHPEHQAMLDQVDSDFQSASRAHKSGGVDTAAIRRLSPSRFEGVPDSEHDQIARKLAPSLGIVRETAMRKALNQAPAKLNVKLQRMTEVIQHDLTSGPWTDRSGRKRDGRSSIVFTDSLEEAKLIHEHLSKQGMAVGMYHGQLGGEQRKQFRADFNKGHVRVAVMTSAGEAGVNMQEGSTQHNYDVPMTAKSHQQRAGRAYRQGQKGDVDIHNWTTDTDYERKAQRRLMDKGRLGAVFQTPLGAMDEHGFAADYHKALNAKHSGFDVADPLRLAAK